MTGSSETSTSDNSLIAQIRVKISTNRDTELLQTGRTVSSIHDLITQVICLPLFYEARSIAFAPSSANEIEGKSVQNTGSGSPEECPTALRFFSSFSV